MFRLKRRKSRKSTALPVDVSTTHETEISVVDVSTTHETEISVVEDTDVDTATDSRFLAMIAQLDTALDDLSRTCDRIEQAVAGSCGHGWDADTTDVMTVEDTASTARLAA